MTERKSKSSPDYSAWGRMLVEASGDGAASKPPCEKSPAGLHVVATPIGNLGDMTLRALHTLSSVDLVLCEDTRVTGSLLHRYGIKNALLSYHDHNARERIGEVMARLAAGGSVAIVSDAGTPLISDPGFQLVRACRAAGFPVIAAPGASALLTALTVSGLPTDRFLFAGFLPPKRAARRKALEELATVAATLAFYEAPSRLADALQDMAEVLGGRSAVVARELTKLFEETVAAPLPELAEKYRHEETPKGEIVIIVEPPAEAAPDTADIDALLRHALKSSSLRDAAAIVATATGAKRSEVYKRALELEGEGK